MNKIIPFLLFLIIIAQACTPEKVATTLASILTQGSGKWKVTFAKFGDEEPPRGMYDRFLIEFRGGDVYVTTNPDGAISPATLPRGTWKESNGKITFDGTVVVREITDYDPVTKRLFVINSTADRLEILDFSNPSNIQSFRL
ncbi:MAG: hypothetical protein OHK0057_28110 [Thermoflexibacter sp.]